MNKIEHHGWSDSIKIGNERVELIASTQFGPRIMHISFIGGANLLHADPEWHGKTGPIDQWVNYGGHRLWFAPEVHPITYGPDNAQVEQIGYEDDELVLTSRVEEISGIQKELRVEVAPGTSSAIKVSHVLTNHNVWPIELAPWALSVVAEGGRVVFPQEPYKAHGEDNDFLPSRPLILWPFTDMSDSRWTWGKELIQLRSDKSLDSPQKIGVFNTLGWGAFIAQNGDTLVKILEVEDFAPEEYPDYGSTFEAFTKGAFQEIETLGPLELIEPGDSAEHVEYWYLANIPDAPVSDKELSTALAPVLANARHEIAAFGIGLDF